MKLASFGLGDTSYRYFNKAVVDIQKRFERQLTTSQIIR